MGLSPKAYIMQNAAVKKLSHKGVPKTVELNDIDYASCLYDNNPGSISYHNITISKKHSNVRTQKTTKRALNSLYMKFHVQSDKITVRPHMRNGKFL